MIMDEKARRAEAPADSRERISVDPNVCHGKPCIKGTRIADIRAALGYAAWLAREEEELPLHTETIGA